MPENSLDCVFVSFRASLARAVSRIVPPREIEDIVQETYVRVCQIKDQDSIRHPRSFLMRTARNLALDHIKRAESRLTVGVGSDDEFYEVTAGSSSVDETFEDTASKEEFAHFCDAVRQLPVQARRVFVMKKVYGHSQQEIASQLNLSESTVEKHIALGIKRCTYYMTQLAQDSGGKGAKLPSSPSLSRTGKGGRP